MPNRPIVIATRGSALALAQANAVFDQCRKAFPRLQFEMKIVKTTGDKLQTASMTSNKLPKGLFTKELEVALLKHRADLAVHSLKDLPTEVPAGLKLGAVGKREDVRDVLIYRDAQYLKQQEADVNADEWTPGQAARRGFGPRLTFTDLPEGAVLATGSTRRKAQVLADRPDLHVVEIRGNVTTRLRKVAERAELDATLLALAGLKRLNFEVTKDGHLTGDAVPDGLFATVIEATTLLPCVGQGAVGIEIREGDERLETLCARLNHYNTLQCVTAERAFLAGMGGGCQSPVAAHAIVEESAIRMQAVSFVDGCRRTEATGRLTEPETLGQQVATALK